jgi:hypothetical protein
MISDIEFIHKDLISEWSGDQDAMSVLGESIDRLVHGEY